jgi:hypothetical protein
MLIVSFALGSAGAFMLFDWPMLIREIVLTFLMAAVVTWGVRMYVIAMLVPSFMNVENAVEVRALPITNDAADHWSHWLSWIVGVFAFFAAAFILLPGLGIDPDGMLVLSVGACCCSFCLPFGAGQEHSETVRTKAVTRERACLGQCLADDGLAAAGNPHDHNGRCRPDIVFSRLCRPRLCRSLIHNQRLAGVRP